MCGGYIYQPHPGMVGKPNVKQIASNRYSADLEITE